MERRRRGGGGGGGGGRAGVERKEKTEQRPAAWRQLSAGPQLHWMLELSEPGSSLTSHTHWDCLHGRERVCVGGEGGVKACLAEAEHNRTEALSVIDKRQAPSVKSTQHQESFSLADAKSMTESLAGGRGGGGRAAGPLPVAPSSAGLKIQREASPIRDSLQPGTSPHLFEEEQ
ncbi:unnamed protein product [Pleuronectes platessa]|uniref:Uncharacterized protein n=1 Tax=Pleuronectes platessa TaxID=8262 RepID=A0A9N7Z214_PLEPL|nr:unnamed protein product [Pleuronectes platessa]